MTEAIWVAIISAIATVIGVLVSNRSMQNKMMYEFDVSLKVLRTEVQKDISELTREVRAHNNFAQRVPVVENSIESIEKRLDRLERK